MEIPAVTTVAVAAGDDLHHISEGGRRSLARIRDEVEIAQSGAVGEHESLEAGEERCVVERGGFEVMMPARSLRRPARDEVQCGAFGRKRTERRFLERRRRDCGDLAPRMRERVRSVAQALRIRGIGRVVAQLMGEDRERQRVEGGLVGPSVGDEIEDAAIELFGLGAILLTREVAPHVRIAARRELMSPLLRPLIARPPSKRADSTLMHRSTTTSSPARSAIAIASSLITPY
jgi:hypothetical protein